jgi:hypothetical protein
VALSCQWTSAGCRQGNENTLSRLGLQQTRSRSAGPRAGPADRAVVVLLLAWWGMSGPPGR